MRLIRLTANKKSFRTIALNSKGLSLIVGKQKDPEKSDLGKTYNGVGKSLSIALVHFCLGASPNPTIADAIPDWEFSLQFEVRGTVYIASRNTSSQNKITLNGAELSVPKFRERLQDILFDIPSDTKGLTFRSLFNRFIRPRKDSYNSFDTTHSKEKPYDKLLANGFLLGLETDLITEKHRLKEDRDRIKQIQDNLKKDPTFIEFFTENKNVDIELKDLEDKIEQLSSKLKSFEVADNYHAIQKEADAIKRELQELKNTEIVITNAIDNITLSLESQPDIPPDKLERIYEEARAKLPDSVVKTIKDVAAFHKKLISNRVKRLSGEKARFEKELRDKRKSIATMGKKLDSYFQYLSTHRALDELVELSNYVGALKAKAQKIRDYKGLLEEYSERTQEINISLGNENRRATKYLKAIKSLLDENLNRFRGISKRLYPDKPGGLTVTNNEGENQIRFDIEAHIQDDASDGINEVKIFCFDMTLLLGQHNHHVECLFHDSRLFSDIDPRQRAMLFRIAYELTNERDLQYVAAINEEQLESIRPLFTPEEFDRIITKAIVLELTDESASEKLLGIQVDMKYMAAAATAGP